MQQVTLNNGVQMPILGFGVFQIADAKECERSVVDAIETGYRLIDTAASYMNEEAVGKGLRRSGVAREDLFVTSKLWVQDAGYERTRQAIDKSLRRLQLDHLDLYLIHQPFGDVYGSWRAMQELQSEGLIRAIGVSNFLPDRLVDLIDHNEIVPTVNQVECHPFLQLVDEQELMRELGVQVESWGPLGQGRSDLFGNPTLTDIARTHGKSVAQVVLRWLVQRGVVVIPKTVRVERLRENFDVFDFELSAGELARIAALDTRRSLIVDYHDPGFVARLGKRTID